MNLVTRCSLTRVPIGLKDFDEGDTLWTSGVQHTSSKISNRDNSNLACAYDQRGRGFSEKKHKHCVLLYEIVTDVLYKYKHNSTVLFYCTQNKL